MHGQWNETTGRELDGPGVAVTVVAGLDRQATALLTAGLLLRSEACASIWVDPTTAPRGHVVRVVDDSSGRHETDVVDLLHGCVSCTVREAVVQALWRLRRDGRCRTAVVELHPGTPVAHATEALCAVLPREVAVVDTVVAVLDAAHWLDDLAGDEGLAERGLATTPDDDRTVAVVLGDQLDLADRIVLVGDAGSTPAARQEAADALRALAPSARRLVPATVLDAPVRQLLATAAHDPRCLHPLADRGLLDWSRHPPATDGPLGVVRWRSERPLHPGRLYDAVDSLASGVVRSAGRLWLAHSPGTAIRWDSWGGSLALGPSAPWSIARSSKLAFLGHDLDARAVRDRLDACRLTDEELTRSEPA